MNRDHLHWIPFLLILPIQWYLFTYFRDKRVHIVSSAYCAPLMFPRLVLPVIQKYENVLVGIDGMIVTSFLVNGCLVAHFNRLDDKFLVPFLASLMLFYVFFAIGCGCLWNFIKATSPKRSRSDWSYECFFLLCHVLMVPFGTLLNHLLLFYAYLLVLDRYLIRNAESLHLQPALWRLEEFKNWDKMIMPLVSSFAMIFVSFIPLLLLYPFGFLFKLFLNENGIRVAYWPNYLAAHILVWVLPKVQSYQNMIIGLDGMIATSFAGNICLMLHFNRLDDKFLVPIGSSFALFYIFHAIGNGSLFSTLHLIETPIRRESWSYEWFFLTTFLVQVPFANIFNHILHFYTYLLVLDRYLLRNCKKFKVKAVMRIFEEFKDVDKIIIATVHTSQIKVIF